MVVNTKIELTIPSRLMLNKSPAAFRRGFHKGMKLSLLHAEAQVKEKGFSGLGSESLRVRTGHLRRSIKSKMQRSTGGFFRGSVFSNVVYARIHETGGVISGRPLLTFNVGGRWVRTGQVTIPSRKYMSNPILKSVKKMRRIITKSIINEVDYL